MQTGWSDPRLEAEVRRRTCCLQAEITRLQGIIRGLEATNRTLGLQIEQVVQPLVAQIASLSEQVLHLSQTQAVASSIESFVQELWPTNAGPLALSMMQKDDVLFSLSVVVEEPFDAIATLAIGPGIGTTYIVGPTEVDFTTLDSVGFPQPHRYKNPTTLQATWNPNGATSGFGYIVGQVLR